MKSWRSIALGVLATVGATITAWHVSYISHHHAPSRVSGGPLAGASPKITLRGILPEEQYYMARQPLPVRRAWAAAGRPPLLWSPVSRCYYFIASAKAYHLDVADFSRIAATGGNGYPVEVVLNDYFAPIGWPWRPITGQPIRLP